MTVGASTTIEGPAELPPSQLCAAPGCREYAEEKTPLLDNQPRPGGAESEDEPKANAKGNDITAAKVDTDEGSNEAETKAMEKDKAKTAAKDESDDSSKETEPKVKARDKAKATAKAYTEDSTEKAAPKTMAKDKTKAADKAETDGSKEKAGPKPEAKAKAGQKPKKQEPQTTLKWMRWNLRLTTTSNAWQSNTEPIVRGPGVPRGLQR